LRRRAHFWRSYPLATPVLIQGKRVVVHHLKNFQVRSRQSVFFAWRSSRDSLSPKYLLRLPLPGFGGAHFQPCLDQLLVRVSGKIPRFDVLVFDEVNSGLGEAVFRQGRNELSLGPLQGICK